MNLYSVKVKIKDPEESSGYRTIIQFHAIPAITPIRAIRHCKILLSKVGGMTTLENYKWFAEKEWENNLAVN